VSAIAADVYGPGDDFSPETAHVAAALIHRMHDAKLTAAPAVDIWGTGRPRRELIYADDLAAACLFAMRHYDAGDPINLGTGADISIAQLASLVRDVLGYSGALRFDTAKPDGTPFKRLDSTLLRDMGWRPRIDLRTGLERTYQWFLSRLVTAGNARSS
jgi:GDP-L-fucose synthase